MTFSTLASFWSHSIWYSEIGLPLTSMSVFGFSFVSGLSRIPRPPARTTAFTEVRASLERSWCVLRRELDKYFIAGLNTKLSRCSLCFGGAEALRSVGRLPRLEARRSSAHYLPELVQS